MAQIADRTTKARYSSVCPGCGRLIWPGQLIGRVGGVWLCVTPCVLAAIRDTTPALVPPEAAMSQEHV